ncbi:MAG: hypothetical protein CL920_16500 [Deltaproteobacteria bacterium]|nr:hypothetical protein [Deltaproteobacteria bacterium]MBU50290.1 hypothetical protein [Deltaproteobacteria bacterium]|tara:strand:- start:1218 stop:2324 length:1107 start_codon:yes stop_codon:yes gene_type:complete
MSVLTWLCFWGAFLALLWTYIGYPVAIFVLSKLFGRAPEKSDVLPTISVVMAVRGQADLLQKKLENFRKLQYPKEKVEWIVVLDGPTLAQFAILEHFPEVQVLYAETPKGKPHALNLGVARACHDLIFFCDVRQRLAENVLEELASYFVDETVGAVSGELVMDTTQGPGMYWRYERAIRKAEGHFDSTIGATGAIYMLRRSLYKEVPTDLLLDDMFIPLQAVLAGYRVLFAPDAKAYDTEATLQHEFRRKTRTLAGNFQLLEAMPSLLHPFKNRLFLQFICHKLMRLLGPYFLLLFFVSHTALVLQGVVGPFVLGLWIGHVCFYMGALLEGSVPGVIGRLSRFTRTFVTLNIAAAVGFYRYLRRDFAW